MKKSRNIFVSLFLILVMLVFTNASFSQIGVIWSTESEAYLFLGSANMDGDPNEELVYFAWYSNDPERIMIYDGVNGSVDWDSGEWSTIYIAGHSNAGTPFIDRNGDGIKEITFGGKLNSGDPYQVYVVGQGGSGISGPGGNQAQPGIQVLSQNYPNPFNPSTSIQYTITAPGNVSVKIYNSLGREVRSVVNEFKQSGEHSVVWDGKDNGGNSVASGTYFYQMQVGDFTSAKKAILIK